MNDHLFHRTIRELLSSAASAPCRWIWDQACGGAQRVSLFRESSRSRQARYTCVDAALVDDSGVQLILEIEEVGTCGFGPQRIFGKFYTAAHRRYLIHRGRRGDPMCLGPAATFIQVLSNAKLKLASSKIKQYRNIESDIRARLPFGKVAEYLLIAARPEEFASGTAGQELQRAVAGAVWRSRNQQMVTYVGPKLCPADQVTVASFGQSGSVP